MEELLKKIAESGYRDEDGHLLTNDRNFHELMQRVKEVEKKGDEP